LGRSTGVCGAVVVVSMVVDAVRAAWAPEPQSAQTEAIGTNENVATATAASTETKIFLISTLTTDKGSDIFISTTRSTALQITFASP
jgi:hypothetical protein